MMPTRYDLENSLGGRRDFEALFETLNEAGSVALLNNYLFAGESSDISFRGDIASGAHASMKTQAFYILKKPMIF